MNRDHLTLLREKPVSVRSTAATIPLADPAILNQKEGRINEKRNNDVQRTITTAKNQNSAEEYRPSLVPPIVWESKAAVDPREAVSEKPSAPRRISWIAFSQFPRSQNYDE
ncbi:hypothetical protein L596_026465 [Steinernema carpocapsae]|uniref:Uncharacterized protein n=1 Tax=Steinernema carpocapsae TaxID=34508 RepID=A0A4U5M2G2_STECR|nr:hypothetical protein L596_026465 [Steinernema carpocapsae]